MPFKSERKGGRSTSSNGPIDQSALAADPIVNKVPPEARVPEHLPERVPEHTPVVTPVNQRVSSGHMQGSGQ